MNFRLLGGAAALGLAGILGLTLAGCGGGSSAATSVTRSPALSGAVQAPQSQTRSVSRSAAAPDPLVPVSGATVTLVNLDDSTVANGVVGTTTTGADGSYSFPTVTPGTNYKVEAVKTIGTKTLTLDAVVTAPAAPAAGTTPPAIVPHDLTPNSTVAAVAVIAQVAALKAADPTSKHTNLQALADDLVKKRVADNTPPPDCTNPAAVNSDANTLRQATAPKGSYSGLAITTAVSATNTGTKVGDTNQLAAQIDASGHFLVTALDNHQGSSTNNGTSGNGNNSGAKGGSNNGGATGTTTQGGGDDSNFAFGTVTTDGIVNATTKNGHIKIVGIFNSGVGSGTYQSSDGSESGTWSLTLLKSKYAGLYAGKYVSFNSGNTTGGGNGNGSGGNTGNGGGSGNGTGNGSGDGTGSGTGSGSGGSGSLNLTISSDGVKGDFALLVLDDNTAIISGAGSATTSSVYGTGTVSATGVLTFTVTDGSGGVSTGTGQIDPVAHTVTGTYTVGAVEGGQFAGRSDHADTSDL